MPRNKYPEETVKKILDVSLRLFVEQGYENTSVQDIIDNLGGLTKGAIYHHFKSKEDIMLAVLDRQYEEQDAQWVAAVRDDTGMTGLKKLSEMFRASVSSIRQDQVFRSAPNMLKNPKMLTLQIESNMTDAAPNLVQPIIEQGIADGSIQTEYPRQLAEVILLLVNLWVSPMVFSAPPDEMIQRALFFRQLMQGLGVDFLDDDIMERFQKLVLLYNRHK